MCSLLGPETLLVATQPNTLWYVLPLAVGISLVYSASRYELPERILKRSLNLFVKIMGFLVVIFLVLMWLSAGL